MRLLLFSVLFILFLPITFAESYNYTDVSLRDQLKYNNAATDLNSKIKKYLFNKNFRSLSSHVLPEFYFANFAYMKNENTGVYIKFGVDVDKKIQNQFLKIDHGMVYHFKNSDWSVAILYKNLNEAERLSINSKIKYEISSLKKTYVFNRIINELGLVKNVYADSENCAPGFTNMPITGLADHEKIANKGSHDSYFSIAGDCFMEALKGAWEGTGGMVSDIGSGIWNFIKSPIKSIGKAWDSTVNMVKATSNFMTNLSENLGKLTGVLANLGFDMVKTLLCSVIGNLGGDQLLKFILNPAAGAVLLAASVAKMITKITKVGKVLEIIDKMKNSVNGGVEAVKLAINNLIKGSEKFLDNIKSLSDNGLEKLTMRYATCGG